MLNERGGVVDDLIVYWRDGGTTCNIGLSSTPRPVRRISAGCLGRDRVDVGLRHRDDLVMLAVQGPTARELAAPLLPADLRARRIRPGPRPFSGSPTMFVGRTGYTGEDG